MKRPKKNKIHNPTLPDDQQIDERNLVDLEDSVDISIEDRISMYWMENKAFLTGCITVLALLIIGFNGMRMYKNHAEAKLQSDYAEAQANDTLASFAKANSNKDLGGLAALTTADDAYRADDFATALEFYGIAADALSDNILAGRAALGQAFALYRSGSETEGLAKLNAIAANSSLPESARAEAAYHLAIEADVAGRSDEFDSYASQVNDMAFAGQWKQRLGFYQQQAK
jgi:predicted negative regulator of RcsB-dependent stress response